MGDKRSNVLFINHSVRDGGPGKSLLYILKYLDRDRIDPHVLIPRDDIFSDNLKAENIYSNIIVDNRFPENLFRPVISISSLPDISEKSPYIRKLVRFVFAIINIVLMTHLVLTSRSLIRSRDINLIYCNGTIAKIVGALMGYFNDTPVIWHVRNIQQTKILGFIINYLSGFDCVKKVICVSKATASQFKKTAHKTEVIYNGLDPEAYNPEKTEGTLRKEYGISDETVIVGSTGRLVPRKGYEEFILNTPTIFENIGDKERVMFVIVGDTPHFFHLNYMERLKNLTEEIGFSDRFVFTGYRKEIRPYLKDMDIFFIPSNYPDPFPRSVIEAMAYSLPVTGFSIGGIAESFEHGVSGFHSEPGDYDDLMKNISTLVNSRELREEMGRRARQRVCRNFRARDISENIQEIILDVLAPAKSK